MGATPETIREDALKVLREEMASWKSPWLTRDGAAAYAGCSATTIDSMRGAGKLKTYWFNGLPRFKKAEIDEMTENGKAPLNGRGAHKKPKLFKDAA